MYDYWLFFPPFLFPPKKKERNKKKNSKTGFKKFFFGEPFDFTHILNVT